MTDPASTRPPLLALHVADEPAVWASLGFHVGGDGVRIGDTTVVLGAPGKGIVGWSLGGLAVDTPVAGLENLAAPRHAAAAAAHPNGVVAIDHLVVMAPDLDATVASLEALGMACRRRREGEAYGRPMRQAFFWLGEGGEHGTILELVGPPSADPAGGAPAFFGIALTVSDLTATEALLAPHVKPPVDAVQPGRRITTISSKAGSTVAIALMTPHVRA